MTRSTLEEPGIGMTLSLRRRHQPMASWAGVTPLDLARSLTAEISLRLVGKFSADSLGRWCARWPARGET